MSKHASISTLLLQDHQDPDASGKQISYYSALSFLRGKVYDALENHGRAVKWYQAALKADPFCYEAFQVMAHPDVSTWLHQPMNTVSTQVGNVP